MKSDDGAVRLMTSGKCRGRDVRRMCRGSEVGLHNIELAEFVILQRYEKIAAEEKAAKGRQKKAGKSHGRGQKVVETLPQANSKKGKSRDKVGDIFGVSACKRI